MARTKNFDLNTLKASAYYMFAESNENANVGNIAKLAKMSRTQLQNHYKLDDLRILALEHALDLLTSNVYRIFKVENSSFEIKIKIMVLHYMTKARRHPNLVFFIGKEFDLLENETIKRLRQKITQDLEPFKKELEKQIDQNIFVNTNPLQFLMYIMSLSSYPIIAGRSIEIITGSRPLMYKETLSKQRHEVVKFILKGFKKDIVST